MSEQLRTNPVFGALNHIPTLCGIQRPYFVGVCAAAMTLFIGSKQTLLSIGIGFAAYIAIYMVCRSEPDYITLYLAAAGLPTTYDPGKFRAAPVTEL